jgi:hypothetical protein
MRTILTLAFAVALLVPAAGRADEQADVQKIIDKAIQAHGEKAGKGKASVFKMKGKIHVAGQDFDYTGEFKTQQPNQTRMDLTLDVGGQTVEFVQALNGDKGWKSAAGNVEDLNKDELHEAKENAYANYVSRLRPLKEKGYKLSALGEKKVGERAAVGIKVAHEGHSDISMYFDKEKALLLATERRVKDPMTGQELTQETIFADYKPVDGVQQPHKMTINRDGKPYVEGEISDFKHLDEIDGSTFAKP